MKPTPGDEKPPGVSLAGLDAADAGEARRLMQEKKDIETKIKAAEAGQKVFGGLFRKPDVIHRLHRGDPEQPKEKIVPAVLSALGILALRADTPEPERRRALAEWIASPENPLTAR